jgi:hypothetical protein
MMSLCRVCFLSTLVGHALALWILGGIGESCTQACTGIGQECSPSALRQHNTEVNSEREVAAWVERLQGTCSSYNVGFGSHTDVPAYDVTSGECYVSDMVRDEVHFSCDRSAAHTKKRLCWCESAIASSNDVADKAQAEGDDEIGTDVIIWIVIGNMVFLGILAVCCGLTCKLMQRCRGASETPPGEVASTFVRCPACGVPLERSTSPSTAPAKRMPSKPATTKSSLGLRHGDEDTISNRTSQTVKFQDVVFDTDMSVSDVSKSANAV